MNPLTTSTVLAFLEERIQENPHRVWEQRDLKVMLTEYFGVSIDVIKNRIKKLVADKSLKEMRVVSNGCILQGTPADEKHAVWIKGAPYRPVDLGKHEFTHTMPSDTMWGFGTKVFLTTTAAWKRVQEEVRVVAAEEKERRNAEIHASQELIKRELGSVTPDAVELLRRLRVACPTDRRAFDARSMMMESANGGEDELVLTLGVSNKGLSTFFDILRRGLESPAPEKSPEGDA
jgi:hypothetical protein